jgi:ABC-type molybdate transport system ATPase subunit
MLAGLLSPDTGSIHQGASVWYDGKRGISRTFEERGVAYLSQNVCLFPHMDAWTNLLFAAGLCRSPWKEAIPISPINRWVRRIGSGGTDTVASAERLVGLFGIKNLMDKKLGQLSGGQVRKVALARLFLRPACLYLLDEPLTGIDPVGRQELTKVLEGLLDEVQAPAIWVTHSPEEVACVADEMAEFSHHEGGEWMGWSQGEFLRNKGRSSLRRPPG